MNKKDKVLIAFRNINAGKQMIKKMIFGMAFVVMLLLCFITIAQSYSVYCEDFNVKNSSDCYYYTEFESQRIESATMDALLNKSREMLKKYQAKEFSVLPALRPHEFEYGLAAKNTNLTINGEIHLAVNLFLNQRRFYQNIASADSLIELGLYKGGISVFADKIAARYGEGYLLGRYPENPGEIMLDDYILSVYGINNADEKLLGTSVSISYVGEERDEIILNDYVLTGIFQDEMLAYRENTALSDYHLEHIYVNLRSEDESGFDVSGSIRYYFDNYDDYVQHYENIDDIFRLNVSEVLTSEAAEVKLTARGLEYCILYWLMNNMGKLLLIIAAVIGLIITFSVFYIFRFYRNRNERYIIMLYNIGMEKKDRAWIFSAEMCFVAVAATVLGVYLSAVFLLLFNTVTSRVLNFRIVFMFKSYVTAILLSWLYFWVCLKIVMYNRK